MQMTWHFNLQIICHESTMHALLSRIESCPVWFGDSHSWLWTGALSKKKRVKTPGRRTDGCFSQEKIEAAYGKLHSFGVIGWVASCVESCRSPRCCECVSMGNWRNWWSEPPIGMLKKVSRSHSKNAGAGSTQAILLTINYATFPFSIRELKKKNRVIAKISIRNEERTLIKKSRFNT